MRSGSNGLRANVGAEVSPNRLLADQSYSIGLATTRFLASTGP